MKKWLLFVVSLFVVIGMTACSGNSGTADSTQSEGGAAGESAGSGAKGKITFAYWGAQTEADAIKQVIADFEKSYPDIKVESQWIQQDYLTKLQTMIAGGTAPDVMLISGGDLPGFASAFQEQQVDPSAFSSPSLVDSLSVDGKAYAVPFIIKPKVMAINLDLFKKNNIPLPSPTEPMTMDQFDEMAKKLAAGEGSSKVFGSEPLYLPNLIYSFGGTFYSDDHAQSLLGSPEAIKAGEYIVAAKQEGIVPSDNEKQGQNMMNWFLSGRIGMYTDFGPWYIPQLADVKGFDWDIVPFPGGGGSKEVNGLALSKDSKNAEAAKIFIQHLTQDEEAQKIIGGNKSAYGVPVLASATGAFEQIYPGKNLKAFVLASEKQHPQEAQKRTNEIGNEMKAIDDQTPIGIGSKAVKEVFPQVAEKIDNILKQK
ncbi:MULTISPECIES: ABC transporter substrate-binding protein [unclassified Paenibacillus]|uniref:ABC transporter substrate-binding protein n=1 Tax=unclassified Paenibacillus TaxID=185978 RepID=UPI0011AB70EE|nr:MULTISPECIES: sugar ABC transporter substrate-binding protein [unclassified Paenibacillus]MBJ9991130.1 sugar ABC transporter substrate-binding protein [Paenibacillus sp. S28]